MASFSVFLLIILNLLNIVYTQPQNVNSINRPEILKAISDGSEQFALDLFKRLSIEVEPYKYNFMTSPFSIWTLLVLIAEGARGETLNQLKTTLRLNAEFPMIREGYKYILKTLNVNYSTIEVSSMQAIFSDKNRPVNPDYGNVIENSYKANLIPVDFHEITQAKNYINSYINNATRGLIDSIVIDDDLLQAQMVLVSTIFFKGQWKYPFNYSLTTQESFYDEYGNRSATVQMMFQRGVFPYAGIEKIDSYVLELVYGKEDRLAMLIILPKKGTKLTTVLEKLSNIGVHEIYNEIKKAEEEYADEEVEVHIPRFSTTSHFVLNPVLDQMGIRDVFNSVKSDLSKINPLPTFLSRFIHKTHIEVNEEGTIASAVSAGVISNKATPMRFYINRPFAYIIIEKTTHSLLFCGQVINPTKQL